MSNQVDELSWLDGTNIVPYIKDLLDDKDLSDSVQDFQFSNAVLKKDSMDLSPMLKDYSDTNIDNDFLDNFQSPIVSTDFISPALDNQLTIDAILANEGFIGDEFDEIVIDSSPEDTIVPEDNNQSDISETQETMSFGENTNQFADIVDAMIVKEQPKADQRARYESDGPRFLPDSKKHPMSIQLPNLSSASLSENTSFGIVVTMVTSTKNPKNKTFVHVNGIKYRTEDAIEIDYGSIFLPLTKSDIIKCEKKFPRLSRICKKFEDYTFDLTSFDTSTVERITEKYTLANEDSIGKVAKGKQFTIDYDLLCYKIIFQLALKQDNIFIISHIKCETDIINEQKTATKSVKRKASSNKRMPKKRKCNNYMSTMNSSKKFNSSASKTAKRSVNIFSLETYL
ncbi:unnamed protein product [Rotaria sordida]|uniref:Uncharacterized protein n=1 Tax=Rotaria sordida TaxID=392033 RepID=A0A814L6P6_9BILA|nr:unnamed protein product [Rotaria sordida]CAF3974424.1 unnamed protein product [Rotaria sordida]